MNENNSSKLINRKMVFYYTCIDPAYKVYMGRDKFENEKLIEHGWPEDVWFHVDNLSSAHVYLRLKEGETIDDIPEAVLTDMCQLTKNNSIQGCKAAKVDIVYTPWANLRKESNMDVGQVSFKSNKMVRKQKHIARDRDIVKRLEKSRVEVEDPDLAGEKARRDRLVMKKKKEEDKEKKRVEKEEADERRKIAEMKNYKGFFDDDMMTDNQHMDEDYEDNFM